MRKRVSAGAMTLVLMAMTTIMAIAAAESLTERGQELFNSKDLGTTGMSCASCHPEGRGLEDVSTFGEKKLERIVNQCITKALKGQALPEGSPDLEALAKYLGTMGKLQAK